MKMDSMLVRRIHMFLALFLMPWMLTYALSTIGMNHSKKDRVPAFQLEFERHYALKLEEEGAVRQILQDLQYSGPHTARVQRDGKIVIGMNRFLFPRRITYDPGTQKLKGEKLPFRFSSVLERIHKRAGPGNRSYQAYFWAFAVEVVALAIVLWLITGFWMFMKIQSVRRTGFLFLFAGTLLFTVFLITI